MQQVEENFVSPVRDLKREVEVVFPRTSMTVLYNAAKAVLRRGRCSAEDRALARSVLQPSEYELWSRMSDYEQRHAVHSVHDFERRVAGTSDSGNSLWMSAALLHDVGKMAANLTVPERVIGTIIGKYSRTATARQWFAKPSGLKHRIGTFLMHGEVGAEMIRAAGGRDIVALWCRYHQHLEFPLNFPIPPHVVAALTASEE